MQASSVCLSLAACSLLPGPDGDGETELGEAKTFVSIDINPSVEMTLDESGIAVSVRGANEDGVILLYGEEENIVGEGLLLTHTEK